MFLILSLFSLVVSILEVDIFSKFNRVLPAYLLLLEDNQQESFPLVLFSFHLSNNTHFLEYFSRMKSTIFLPFAYQLQFCLSAARIWSPSFSVAQLAPLERSTFRCYLEELDLSYSF